MRILALCDLHNEFGRLELGQTDCDVVVLAGDTDVGIHGTKWALETFKEVPIIYICGNHEYYGKKIYKIHRLLKELSEDSNLYFLEDDELILDNIRFLGCTLWTDFCLYGEENRRSAMYIARQTMTDFRRITHKSARGYHKLSPLDTAVLHSKSVRYLQTKLEEPFDGETIVVTHHLPTPKSIPEYFKDNIINAAYCTDLEWMIVKYRPKLWIHGHVHDEFDYSIGDTRIICNARGYFPKVADGFQKDLILEV